MNIWALATQPERRTRKNCARVLTGLIVCDEHRGLVTPQDFFSIPESRARVMTAFQRAGAAMPDLSSAKVDLEEIVGEPTKISDLIKDARGGGASIIEA